MVDDIFAQPVRNPRRELEHTLGDVLRRLTEAVAKQIKDDVGRIAYDVCSDYVHYAEYEPLDNWKDAVRNELVREAHWRKDEFWGKSMRRAILAEHKEELLPLLRTELIATLEEEVKSLKDGLDFEIKLNRDRYR